MPRTARAFAAVDVDYLNDDRVLAAGDGWQLHFAALLAAKRGTADGYVSIRQLRRAAPDSVTDFDGALAACIAAGLFIEKDDGVILRSWDRWNDSQATIETKSHDALYANHCRHHLGKKAKPSQTCPYCSDPDSTSGPTRTADGSEAGPCRAPREDPDVDLDVDVDLVPRRATFARVEQDRRLPRSPNRCALPSTRSSSFCAESGRRRAPG